MATVDLVNDYVSKYCGVLLSSQAVTGEGASGGLAAISVRWGPLTAVTSITDNYTDETIDSDDYYVSGDYIVNLEGEWPEGFQRYTISYTAGYSSVPSGLAQAITDMTAEVTAVETAKGAFKSEQRNDYSYTIAEAVTQSALPHRQVLDMYRRQVM
jgi:hypothetical protein